MGWTVEYYRDTKGAEPVADFIDMLPTGTRVKVFRTIELLGEYGVLLSEPYTKQVKGKVRELRVKDNRELSGCSTLPLQANALFCCMDL